MANVLLFDLLHLVGGIPTPLKNMTSSVGMMKFPTEWKVIKFMFQTTNQSLCFLRLNRGKTMKSAHGAAFHRVWTVCFTLW